MEPRGESKFGHSNYYGYWLLQNLVLPFTGGAVRIAVGTLIVGFGTAMRGLSVVPVSGQCIPAMILLDNGRLMDALTINITRLFLCHVQAFSARTRVRTVYVSAVYEPALIASTELNRASLLPVQYTAPISHRDISTTLLANTVIETCDYLNTAAGSTVCLQTSKR